METVQICRCSPLWVRSNLRGGHRMVSRLCSRGKAKFTKLTPRAAFRRKSYSRRAARRGSPATRMTARGSTLHPLLPAGPRSGCKVDPRAVMRVAGLPRLDARREYDFLRNAARGVNFVNFAFPREHNRLTIR